MASAQIERIIKRLTKLVKAGDEKGLKPEKAFEHFDRSGSGTVDEEDFIDGLDRLNVTVTPKENKQVRIGWAGVQNQCPRPSWVVVRRLIRLRFGLIIAFAYMSCL